MDRWYGVIYLYDRELNLRSTVAVQQAAPSTRVVMYRTPKVRPSEISQVPAPTEISLPPMDTFVLVGGPMREEDHWTAIYVLDSAD